MEHMNSSSGRPGNSALATLPCKIMKINIRGQAKSQKVEIIELSKRMDTTNLSGSLSIKSESVSKLFFRSGSRPIDLVAENEDGAIDELLVGQEGVELGQSLIEP